METTEKKQYLPEEELKGIAGGVEIDADKAMDRNKLAQAGEETDQLWSNFR